MSFFGSLFGGDQRKDLKKAKAASDAALQSGYDESQPFYTEAKGLYQPYAEAGGKANQLYADTLGVNGSGAQATAEDTYFQDPVQQKILAQKSNALLRQVNARGDTYGARGMLAGQRVGLENYGNWQNQLAGLGGQGLQASGAQAGITSGQGDLRYSLGLAKAGQEINFGNAMAANRNTGINNLLNIGGTVAKLGAAF